MWPISLHIIKFTFNSNTISLNSDNVLRLNMQIYIIYVNSFLYVYTVYVIFTGKGNHIKVLHYFALYA